MPVLIEDSGIRFEDDQKKSRYPFLRPSRRSADLPVFSRRKQS